MLFTIVIGFVHTLVQIAFTIFHLASGQNIGGRFWIHFEFYGDKVRIFRSIFCLNRTVIVFLLLPNDVLLRA